MGFIIKKIVKGIYFFSQWLYVQAFAWKFYDKRYLSGKWFADGIFSKGWSWCARDIHYRIHSLSHMSVKWPISPNIDCGTNIIFDLDDLSMFQGIGNYFQTVNGRIFLGKGTYIAKNVGIITTNHNPYDLNGHIEGRDVIIGKECWLGMNSVVLPGVELGDHTVVGAGAVVTKSFKEGYCVIAGNPAHLIKKLDKEKFSEG